MDPAASDPDSTPSDGPGRHVDFDVDRFTRLIMATGAALTGETVVVEVVSVEPIGTGQMASSYRVAVDHDADPAALPTSFIVKVPVGTPEQRLLGANSYRTEVDFYTGLAGQLDARLARCFGAWRNELGDEFLLILEDLDPWMPGDQLVGCNATQAKVAVENLAGVHGPLWEAPRLAEQLATVGDAEIDGTAAVFGPLTDAFLAVSGDRLSDVTVDVCERFVPLASQFLRAQATHVGIVHGDYRLDNLLFAPDDSAVAVIDWQTVGCGLPARDLAYFIGTSLHVDVRRRELDGLITAYHEGLCQRGVTGYDLETCRDDYAFGLFQIPLTVMFGSAIAAGSERGRAMFEVMMERGAAAMIDAGTLDLL